MQMKLDVPIVEQCTINECAYNEGSQCHARAITIGDGQIPHCDTLFRAGKSYHFTKSVAGVGACKVSGCIHNNQLECEAPGIAVGVMDGDIQCLTFTEDS